MNLASILGGYEKTWEQFSTRLDSCLYFISLSRTLCMNNNGREWLSYEPANGMDISFRGQEKGEAANMPSRIVVD